MKILYGLNGTGNGHICRSREIIRRLKQRGHEVVVLFSGGAPRLGLDDFEPYLIYRGFTFATSRGKVQYVKTAMRLNLARFYRDLRGFDASEFDLVITDFEPISARVARRHDIPSLGIGHQYAFVYDVPTARGNSVGRMVLQRYAPADYPIGLHWHHFGYPILPPIVPDNLRSEAGWTSEVEAGKNGNKKILVYLPWENMHELAHVVRQFDGHEFYLYDASFDAAYDEANLHFRPPSRAGFLEDLATCDGVICNAGFELPSEALHVGKRLLVKALRGQIEQESNALALARLNLAAVTRNLDATAIGEWLEGSAIAPTGYPDVADEIVRWIDEGQWDDGAGLARSLWQVCA